FKTAEEVNNVSIDDSHLSGFDSDDETNMPIIPKAIDVKQLRAKLDGVTAEEYRPNWVPVEGYKVKADGTLGSNSSASYTTIPLKGQNKVRFLGANIASSSSSATKNTGYCLGHYNGAETESNWVIDQYWAYDATGTGSSSVVQEYIINIGANSPSTHFRTNCKYGAISLSNFYCVLTSGDKVVDLLNGQRAFLESEGSIFRLVGNGTTQALSNKLPLMGGHKYRLTLRDENIDLTGTTEGLAATAIRLRVTTYENESDATSTGYLVLVTISETLSKTYEFTPLGNCWARLQMRAAVGAEQVFQIEDITNVPSVIDNVKSQSITDALSANQGRIIGEKTQDIQFDGDILTTEDGTVTQNCFVNRTGETTSNSNCDVVTLDVGDYKTVRFLCVSPTFSNNSNACFAFYNENNSLVGMPCVYSYNLSATSAKRYVVEIDVPSGAKYLKTLCRYYTGLTSAMFYCYGIKKNGIFDTVALMSTDNHETRIDIKALVEEDESGVVEKGYYTYSNNSFSSNTSYRTVKVNVPSNANYLYVNMRCRAASVYLYIYDSNDAILAKFGNPDASSAKTMSNIIDMSMYPTAAYIKVSSHVTTINNGSTACVFSELPYTYSKYFFGDKL
ncbi:MAG: hypothetical protein II630_01185, partial [Bacteroidales bacterium]|nr:hypothetical protein [Bacteroidales bacterium]